MTDLGGSQDSDLEGLVGGGRSFHDRRKRQSRRCLWHRRWYSTFVCSLIAGISGYTLRPVLELSGDGQGKQQFSREVLQRLRLPHRQHPHHLPLQHHIRRGAFYCVRRGLGKLDSWYVQASSCGPKEPRDGHCSYMPQTTARADFATDSGPRLHRICERPGTAILVHWERYGTSAQRYPRGFHVPPIALLGTSALNLFVIIDILSHPQFIFSFLCFLLQGSSWLIPVIACMNRMSFDFSFTRPPVQISIRRRTSIGTIMTQMHCQWLTGAPRL